MMVRKMPLYRNDIKVYSRYIKVAVSFLMLFTHSIAAYNDQDNLNFSVTGTIMQSICTVNVPAQVELGSFSRNILSIAGASSASIPVSIELSNCTPGLTRAQVTFTGVPYSGDTWGSVIYANQIKKGAEHVGLQLINADGNTLVNLANGVNYTFPINQQTRSGALAIVARLYSPDGATTPGQFEATVTLNFLYH